MQLKTIFWLKQASVALIAIWKSTIIRIKALTSSTGKTGDISLLSPTIPTTYNKKGSIAQGNSRFKLHPPHSVAKWPCKIDLSVSKPYFCSICSDDDVVFQLLFFIRRARIQLTWRDLLNQHTRAQIPSWDGAQVCGFKSLLTWFWWELALISREGLSYAVVIRNTEFPVA